MISNNNRVIERYIMGMEQIASFNACIVSEELNELVGICSDVDAMFRAVGNRLFIVGERSGRRYQVFVHHMTEAVDLNETLLLSLDIITRYSMAQQEEGGDSEEPLKMSFAILNVIVMLNHAKAMNKTLPELSKNHQPRRIN